MTFDEVIYDFAAFIALWSVKYNFNIMFIFFFKLIILYSIKYKNFISLLLFVFNCLIV